MEKLRRLAYWLPDLSSTEIKTHRANFNKLYNELNSIKDFLCDQAEGLYKFYKDTGSFYWSKERLYRNGPHHVSLVEVENLLKLYGADVNNVLNSVQTLIDLKNSKAISKAQITELNRKYDGFYYIFGDNRYRWSVVKMAQRVGNLKVLQSWKNQLGNFDTTGKEELKLNIEKWITKNSD
ncbi:MAG: hypothetical protein KC646_03715 [Candidatus Cloacimonetes bacterium]|nr:hypothetical protein [Candidatus Cloacimonadota bacterium]